jgi:hypothetical protein
VQLSSGTATGGLSATAAERVERAGQERLAAEEGFQQGGELLLEFKELPAEGAEVVRHGSSRRKRMIGVCRLLYIYIYRNQDPEEKNPPGAKIVEFGWCAARAHPCTILRDAE